MRKPRMYLTSSPKLLRSGAFAPVIGGFLFAVWGHVHKDITPLYLNVIVHVLALIVPVLLIGALATLYPRCAGRAAFLGESGIILGSLGSALGAVRALVDLAVPSLYPHDALSGRILQFLFDVWTPTLFIGLLVVGLAFLATRTSRGVGALLLAMGVFGWAFRSTNSGGIFETRLAHAGLGILFSLGWVALGLTFIVKRARQTKEPHP